MQLQPVLSQYLVENGSLPLPGAGQLRIEQVSAVVNEEKLLATPPECNIIFVATTATESEQQKLVNFISQQLSVSLEQATDLFKIEWQNGFDEYKKIDWAPIGSIHKQPDGTFEFEQNTVLHRYLPPIPLRQIEQPVVATPTAETNEQNLVNEPVYELPASVQKERWWRWAIVILIISLLLIIIRLLG